MKHSEAKQIDVSMTGENGTICIIVSDNGIGFDPTRAVPGDGVGLVAIRERLKLVDGGSTIASRPGEGTRVDAWVPLPKAAVAASVSGS